MNVSISLGSVVRGIVMAGLLLVATHGSWAAAALTVPAGQRQLFLDDYGVAKMENLKRNMHQPAKKGALIRPDWNRNETVYFIASAPSWNPDAKVFKVIVSDIGGAKSISSLWESRDGLHWKRRADSKRVVYCMVRDDTDPDPSRRYKGIGRSPVRGVDGEWTHSLDRFVSPDMVTWRKTGEPFPILVGDEDNLSFDPVEHLFIATLRHNGGPYGRSVDLATSKDFESWTHHGMVSHADDRDQELARRNIEARLAEPTLRQPFYNRPSSYNLDIYCMATFRYEGLYIGMPLVYHATGPLPFERNSDGFNHIQLVCSRDLRKWKRLGGRKAFIRDFPNELVPTTAVGLSMILSRLRIFTSSSSAHQWCICPPSDKNCARTRLHAGAWGTCGQTAPIASTSSRCFIVRRYHPGTISGRRRRRMRSRIARNSCLGTATSAIWKMM